MTTQGKLLIRVCLPVLAWLSQNPLFAADKNDVMKARLQDRTAKGIGRHAFLSTHTDLTDLSSKALKFVRYED